jgi:hypothetical protein
MTPMALPFFIKNVSIFPMTWIFIDPLSNSIMMLQLLDTLVNLPLSWLFLLTIGGLECGHLFNNMWQDVAPANNLKLIDDLQSPPYSQFLPPHLILLFNVVWILSLICLRLTALMLFCLWWTTALQRGQFSSFVQNLLILNKPHNYWWIDFSLDLDLLILSFLIEDHSLRLEPQKNICDF